MAASARVSCMQGQKAVFADGDACVAAGEGDAVDQRVRGQVVPDLAALAGDKVSTPLGSPALAKHCTMCAPAAAPCVGGFSTTVLPAISAGATLEIARLTLPAAARYTWH